ncbi:agamous-like MADS-box protein AGL80 [Trifolium pratense]|uniref:agamous-like MADS-box protein AGL80 n=1 Tax=Trifolium pratense TaxID=57577 RepID=UPI001E6968E1|nr:agamous-like MADS-box protein AGL80 [Trifolium pratense]
MRNKLKLAFVASDSQRKITYNKRKKSLTKKIDELTTLCGVDACVIIFSNFHLDPEIWPSQSSEVQRILTKFKTYSEFEQGKKKLSHESYLMKRITKSREQLAKLEKNNGELQKSLILYQCLANEIPVDTLNLDVLNDVDCEINRKLAEIASKENEVDPNATS